MPEQISHSNKQPKQYQTVFMTDVILNKSPISHLLTFLLFSSTTKLSQKIGQISDEIKRENTLSVAQISGETKHRMSWGKFIITFLLCCNQIKSDEQEKNNSSKLEMMKTGRSKLINTS